MTARLTCWSNSRSEEKTWFHGSGWKILVELNTSKISDSSFSRLSFLVWDRVSCTGLVYPSKTWISNTQLCNSSGIEENKKLKLFWVFFFKKKQHSLVCLFWTASLPTLFLHVIESLGIWHYDQIIMVIVDLGMC